MADEPAGHDEAHSLAVRVAGVGELAKVRGPNTPGVGGQVTTLCALRSHFVMNNSGINKQLCGRTNEHTSK